MDENDLLLVTGATGLVGSHVAERAHKRGIKTRALIRPGADVRLLEEWGVEIVPGDMTDSESLQKAVSGATIIDDVNNSWFRIEHRSHVQTSNTTE